MSEKKNSGILSQGLEIFSIPKIDLAMTRKTRNVMGRERYKMVGTMSQAGAMSVFSTFPSFLKFY